jgi:hypothetical protein
VFSRALNLPIHSSLIVAQWTTALYAFSAWATTYDDNMTPEMSLRTSGGTLIFSHWVFDSTLAYSRISLIFNWFSVAPLTT